MFGPFEVNVPAGELRKHGARLHLPPQPFEILVCLMVHPAEVVTREQLRERIWRDGTFVDFERGLNSAITKLRRILNDSADTPRYIETVTGRGSRFIGTLTEAAVANGGLSVVAHDSVSPDSLPRRTLNPWWWLAAVAAFGSVSFTAGWKLHTRDSESPPWKLGPITAD